MALPSWPGAAKKMAAHQARPPVAAGIAGPGAGTWAASPVLLLLAAALHLLLAVGPFVVARV
jgi:hypothetical protein